MVAAMVARDLRQGVVGVGAMETVEVPHVIPLIAAFPSSK